MQVGVGGEGPQGPQVRGRRRYHVQRTAWCPPGPGPLAAGLPCCTLTLPTAFLLAAPSCAAGPLLGVSGVVALQVVLSLVALRRHDVAGNLVLAGAARPSQVGPSQVVGTAAGRRGARPLGLAGCAARWHGLHG